MKPPPTNALVNRAILLTLALLVFSGSLGLGAVWMRQGISQAANESRAIHVQIADVERRLDDVNALVAAAVNPDALLKKNQSMSLGLVTPREIQVQRVNVSPELRLAEKRNREIFRVSVASLETPARAPSFQFVTAALR
ncbi:hypothetical protein ESB00_13510 [Oleiharenicola lentus]|jgi:hypothetical protein|uniref:Cell division protein FtsL n=1 Tax=Oleiharenicola lentus TaxID=2508720 RepID=A0A4V1M6W7_9BACT|nr:hypothetical protein [Oleiharenicola lentus]RXK56839.1 hypothetical protein ESB00_13510 [Oleiharenicola lentus]